MHIRMFTHLHTYTRIWPGICEWIKPSHDTPKVRWQVQVGLCTWPKWPLRLEPLFGLCLLTKGMWSPPCETMREATALLLLWRKHYQKSWTLGDGECAAWCFAPGTKAKPEKAVFKITQLLHWFDESQPALFSPDFGLSPTSQDK